MVPGVVSAFDSNGRRNESDIFVRGFGRWQVPLMIDGVRVYLPADNRLDFSRFLTSDISEIQISKGYASVLDGPGAMGGAINLVSRKPVKPFEAEYSAGTAFDNRGSFQGWETYGRLGTRQENFYLQGSAGYLDRDFWSLSRDYKPFPAQGAYQGSLEDGGRRIGSDSRDWRINAKVGFTPNATDEYTINFIKQEGKKGAPLNVISTASRSRLRSNCCRSSRSAATTPSSVAPSRTRCSPICRRPACRPTRHSFMPRGSRSIGSPSRRAWSLPATVGAM